MNIPQSSILSTIFSDPERLIAMYSSHIQKIIDGSNFRGYMFYPFVIPLEPSYREALAQSYLDAGFYVEVYPEGIRVYLPKGYAGY